MTLDSLKLDMARRLLLRASSSLLPFRRYTCKCPQPSAFFSGKPANKLAHKRFLSQLTQPTDQDEVEQPGAVFEKMKKANWADAINIIETMRAQGKKLQQKHYHIAMTRCLKFRKWEKTLELFEKMQQRGLKLTYRSYRAAIHATECGNQWKRALELLSEMWDGAATPEYIEYNSVLATLSNTGQIQYSLEIIEQMRRRGEFRPSVITYNIVLQGVRRLADVEMARKLIEEEMLKDKLNPDEETYGYIIHTFAKAGQLPKLIEHFEKSELPPYNRLRPNPYSYSRAIDHCCREGNVDLGIELLNRMKEMIGAGPTEDSYVPIIIGSTERDEGGWENALEWFDQMRNSRIRYGINAFNAAMYACSKGGDVKRVFDLFHMMRRRKIRPEEIAFHCAIDACVKAGEWGKAMGLIEWMQGKQLIRWERSLELLEEMAQAGVKPSADGYKLIIDACREADQPQHAARVEALSKGDLAGVECETERANPGHRGPKRQAVVGLSKLMGAPRDDSSSRESPKVSSSASASQLEKSPSEYLV